MKIFASSDAYKHHLAEGFHTNIEKIVTMPLPRVDLLKSKTYENSIKEKIYDPFEIDITLMEYQLKSMFSER